MSNLSEQIIVQVCQTLILALSSGLALAFTPILSPIKRRLLKEEARISQMNEIIEALGQLVFELENQISYLQGNAAFSSQHLEIVKDYNQAITKFRAKEYLYELWIKTNWPAKSQVKFSKILAITKEIDSQLHLMNDLKINQSAVDKVTSMTELLKVEISGFISK